MTPWFDDMQSLSDVIAAQNRGKGLFAPLPPQYSSLQAQPSSMQPPPIQPELADGPGGTYGAFGPYYPPTPPAPMQPPPPLTPELADGPGGTYGAFGPHYPPPALPPGALPYGNDALTPPPPPPTYAPPPTLNPLTPGWNKPRMP